MSQRVTSQMFWSRVDKTDGCWLWNGTVRGDGYGIFCRDRKAILVHRHAYELVQGPIPEGLTLDHLCRVRNCVNPDHLDPCPAGTNVLRGYGPPARNARKSSCKRGHLFTKENTYTFGGSRSCRACQAMRARRRYRNQKFIVRKT